MRTGQTISIIAAIAASDRTIGISNTLPWRIPSDLTRFRHFTKQAGTVLMGRNTFASVGCLPERVNLVLTNTAKEYVADRGAQPVRSLREALAATKGLQLFVIGGEALYAYTMPHANYMHITFVHGETPSGDTHFPKIDMNEWATDSRNGLPRRKWGERDEFETSYSYYTRVGHPAEIMER